MRDQSYAAYYTWAIAGLALLLFVPFLGNTHLFDWDEINFAESAREMLVTGNYLRVQIDFQPFWEKPPLFFWLQAASMHILGVNELAARFPNVLVGVATLLSFYYLGKRYFNAHFGLLWALVYVGSFTPHLYFKSGIIDPLFNLFMFWSVVCLTTDWLSNDLKKGLWAGVLAGLAVWTKGPVGVGIPTITLGGWWVLCRFKPVISLRTLVAYTLSSALLTLGWVATIILESGWDTFLAFLQYLYNLMATSEADHGEPFHYHFVVVLIGCFPMSVIGLRNLFQRHKTPLSAAAQPLFWVVMIIFSLVKTKIVHYSSLAYFPLSFLATQYLYQWINHHIKWPRWGTVLLFLVGTILCFVLTVVPLVGMFPAQFIPYIDDTFAVANLQAPLAWNGYEWCIGLLYWGCILYALWVWETAKNRAIMTLLTATALCMAVYTAVVVPKIEGYSQRTMIDFYKSKQGQDVYVWPVGFKSYAQYFYFQKPPHSRPESSQEEWLLNGAVDKPTYLISRVDRADNYRKNPNLKFMEERNGFVFFERK